MPDEERDSSLTADEKLLAEIRNRFDYCQDQWADIRKEAQTDMDYVSGNPWPEAERKRREDAGRPCLVMDELSQYTNQLINDIRQNKRAVRVVPRGYGANDKTAELRGDLIREIEYKSNAQSAYACGFENMCNRSYGGWKIVRRYINEKSFDQEIRIVRLPNPDCSYPDPDCKESDYSDAKYWFLVDPIPRKEYKKRWPKAKITDFNGDHIKTAPNWIKEDQIQVAEYWRVETEKRLLLQIKHDDGKPISMFEDELPEGTSYDELKAAGKILNERKTEERTIVQYITNGVEILEENPQPGKYIPIIWLTGKELYVSSDTGPKRVLMSLIRLARDPQMLVNYYRTCEAEVVGMTPKTPWIGVEGQFHNSATWQSATTTPVAYLEYKAKTEATGDQVLPAPERPAYEPQIQPLEIGAESARRAIQAAMGLSSLPTNAQRLNDKSGVALKQIDENEDRGSFHFIDNYEMGLEYSGRIINDMIPYVYDAAREIGIRKGDDKHETVKVNQEFTDGDGKKQNNDLTVGEHEVTISTGPSFQSEREQANEFVDTMVPELEGLQIDPTVKSKLLAMLIRLKNVGPIGDQMADLLDPKDGGNQAQQLQQLAAQSQQYQQMVAQLQAENQKLNLEKQGKLIDNQFMIKKAEMDNKLKLDIAEIQAQHQDVQARAELTQDLLKELHVAAHEAATQAVQNAHDKHIANQQQQNAAAQQASDQVHQQTMAQQQAENQPAQ